MFRNGESLALSLFLFKNSPSLVILSSNRRLRFFSLFQSFTILSLVNPGGWLTGQSPIS